MTALRLRQHFARIFPASACEALEEGAQISACAGKEKYPNGQLAAAVARRRNRNADIRRNVEPYRCEVCRAFHLGRPGRKRR